MTTLSNNHWTLATYRQRMTTKQWREVLLADDDFMAFKGNPCHLKAKNIGAGVVEVYKDIPANKQINTIADNNRGQRQCALT